MEVQYPSTDYTIFNSNTNAVLKHKKTSKLGAMELMQLFK